MIKYRSDIDGIRGISILLVILFHTNFPYFYNGYLGVDIFFVISGFLITNLLLKEIQENGRINLINFFTRRARRILPNIILIFTITLIFAYFFFLPIDFIDYGRSLFSSIFFSSNLYFHFKADYFDTPSYFKPLLHTWSLSIEEQFYLFYPFILIIFLKYYKSIKIRFILIIFVISLIPLLLLSLNRINYSFFLTYFRVYEILFGCLCAVLVLNTKKNHLTPFISNFLSIIFFFITILILFFENKEFLQSYFNNFFISLLTFLIILNNSYKKNILYKILSLNIFVKIGVISYGLYLWHWPIIVIIKYLNFDLSFFEYFFIVFLFSIIFATFTYYYFENPIRMKKLFKSTKTFYFYIILSLITLSLIAFLIITNKVQSIALDKENKKIYERASTHVSLKCNKKIDKNLKICSNNKNKINEINTLVWGDSHAAVFSYELNKHFKKNNINLAFYDCLPLVNVFIDNNENNKSKIICENSENDIRDIVKKYKIKNIVLSSYWSQYIYGIDTRQKGAGTSNSYLSDSKIQSKNKSDALKVFTSNFKKTIIFLNENKLNIWVIKEVPTFKTWVPNEAIRQLKYKQKVNIKRSISEYKNRTLKINDIFENVNYEYDINFIDPSSALCDSEFCYGNDEKIPLYSDFNHLNEYGLDKIRKIFDNFYEKL